jgi:hypothetical protein
MTRTQVPYRMVRKALAELDRIAARCGAPVDKEDMLYRRITEASAEAMTPTSGPARACL